MLFSSSREEGKWGSLIRHPCDLPCVVPWGDGVASPSPLAACGSSLIVR
uniref:Predicted protein n=1 Tax=Hordeum vulgare subsp. vulgare TaxID=112509 RepID=F2ECP2_HORVV|nr:predicted protein [Hordeum vulgare subsp. vulgare]